MGPRPRTRMTNRISHVGGKPDAQQLWLIPTSGRGRRCRLSAIAVFGMAGCGPKNNGTVPSTGSPTSSTPAPSTTSTGAQFDIGNTINYGSLGTTTTLDCGDGKSLNVGGSNNTLTVKGSCGTVSIGGGDNKITIDKIDKNLRCRVQQHDQLQSGRPQGRQPRQREHHQQGRLVLPSNVIRHPDQRRRHRRTKPGLLAHQARPCRHYRRAGGSTAHRRQAVDFRGPALTVLEKMGLLEQVKAGATQMGPLVLVDGRGKEVGRLPAEVISGEVGIHWGAISLASCTKPCATTSITTSAFVLRPSPTTAKGST